jgi:membrane associated rhomboid family serine protease
MATCYRHSGRETGVSCSNCGRPICPDCMTPTPVGMRCPECSHSRTPVRTLRSLASEPTATYVLIALNVVMFVAEQVGRGSGVNDVILRLATLGVGLDQNGNPVGVSQGEYWRLLSGGFLHDVSNPLHIGFNMYILWMLGRMIEPALGHVRFVALYLASLLAGSFGAILVQPTAATIGASGAVFGLMGAAFLMQRSRGIDPLRSGLGMLIGLNLVLQFIIPGVSWGAHVGGLIGGGIAGWAVDRLTTRRGAGLLAPIAVCTLIGVAAAVGAIMVADAKATQVGLAVLSPFG